jgi:transcriptional regulator with XRE-family HTH domain
MAKTTDAFITPALLTWARESAGYTVEAAASKLGVEADTLVAWEQGMARPTVAKLREAAGHSKRPLAIFYLPEPPRDCQPMRDFRRRSDAEVGRLSPKLVTAVRRAHALREAALELREIADNPPGPAPGLDAGTRDADGFGDAGRRLLGLSLDS